ncbi:hypothetical protein RND81_06G147100 [Saponaria officinalis]|uniref:Retrotransposon gag domain-containing protein n=1 Tax=Saponaria officinalis TaxID=3572 RepID=A0AAW1KAM4_SAPOF
MTQGEDTVAGYYARLKSVWEDLRSMDGIPDCSCGAITTCTCNVLKKIIDRDNKHMLIDFLMGLDKKYENLRGQILAMEPLPTVNQAFSKVYQAELQRSLSHVDVPDDGMAMAVNQNNFSSMPSSHSKPTNVWRRDAKKPKFDKPQYYCDYCNKNGHTRDYCFKLRDLKENTVLQMSAPEVLQHPERNLLLMLRSSLAMRKILPVIVLLHRLLIRRSTLPFFKQL